jgi:hypothetical protein
MVRNKYNKESRLYWIFIQWYNSYNLVKIFILIPIFVHYQHVLLKDFIKRNGGIRKDTMGGGEGMRRY